MHSEKTDHRTVRTAIMFPNKIIRTARITGTPVNSAFPRNGETAASF